MRVTDTGAMVIMILTLAIVNFLYQYVYIQDYATALERSFFQALAIFCYVVCRKSVVKG